MAVAVVRMLLGFLLRCAVAANFEGFLLMLGGMVFVHGAIVMGMGTRGMLMCLLSGMVVPVIGGIAASSQNECGCEEGEKNFFHRLRRLKVK